MMHKDKQKSATVCFAAAVLLVCFFTQAIEGFRLTKKEKWDEQKKVDGGDMVHEGEIVFGRALETSSQLWEGSPNASVEDEGTYQADSPGWLKGSSQDQSSKEARWRRMMPSMQCSLDHMRFKAIGPGTSQLTLAQGNGPALPLSQIPPSCGFNMQRNALALIMSVPYDGCNVFQEGGNYVLPLRWQGIPLLLLCTKPTGSPLTTATSYYPITQVSKNQPPKIYVPQTQIYQVPDTPQILPNKYPDDSEPKFPHPIFFPPRPYPEYPPLSVGDSAITIKKPDLSKFPQYHPVPALYPYLPPPFPVATAGGAPAIINSAGQTVLDPSQMFYFHMYPPMFPHPHLPPPGSIMTEQAGKPPVPQITPYMPFLPPPVFPHAHPHTDLHYPTDLKQDITVPPATTEKSDTMHPYQHPHQHSHSYAHRHLHNPHTYAHSHAHHPQCPIPTQSSTSSSTISFALSFIGLTVRSTSFSLDN